MGRVFANGPGDLGLIPGRVIPQTFKRVLDTSLLIIQQYKVRIKGKVEQSREKNSALPTCRCSSYRKGSLQVALDYGRQLYLLYNVVCYIYIYIYIYKERLVLIIKHLCLRLDSINTLSMALGDCQFLTCMIILHHIFLHRQESDSQKALLTLMPMLS